ncbi:MAG: class I SAM-dependent methyltransferase, partial [Planctomycetota bacterium]
MRPIDVLVDHTLRFVTAALPGRGGRVLEVGAGAGHLARALEAAGCDVVAIDASEKAVAQARMLGHDVRHADWLTFEDGRFDAIVFSRSLHHIDDLDRAADRTWTMLQPGGRVIIEEFTFTEADAPTVAWLVERVRAAETALTIPDESLLRSLMDADEPEAVWHAHHGHMHRETNMMEALERGGRIVLEQSVPYLYRYLWGAAKDDEQGARLVQAMLSDESKHIDAEMIRPIGRRL